jgi:hypothetical protein
MSREHSREALPQMANYAPSVCLFKSRKQFPLTVIACRTSATCQDAFGPVHGCELLRPQRCYTDLRIRQLTCRLTELLPHLLPIGIRIACPNIFRQGVRPYLPSWTVPLRTALRRALPPSRLVSTAPTRQERPLDRLSSLKVIPWPSHNQANRGKSTTGHLRADSLYSDHIRTASSRRRVPVDRLVRRGGETRTRRMKRSSGSYKVSVRLEIRMACIGICTRSVKGEYPS